MFKRYVFCLIITVCTAILFATDPWPQPVVLPESMSLLTKPHIDGSPASSGDLLAAYVLVNGMPQLRGKGEIIQIGGISGCLLQIYTAVDGEELRFMIWDQSDESTCHSDQMLSSVVNGTVGSYPDDFYLLYAQSGTQAADPWPQPVEMNSAMTITTKVFINDVPTSANDILAAFVTVGEQPILRGKAPIVETDEGPICTVQVYSESDDEIIYFRVWDFRAQMIYEDEVRIRSVVNGQAGLYPDDLILINPGGTHYVPRPVFSPEPGDYPTMLSISLSCPIVDSYVCYTMDGSEPAEDSPVYDEYEPIIIAQPDTLSLRARAFKSGWIHSAISEGLYTVRETVETPYAYPTGGDYEDVVQVRLFCITPEVSIYYTLDGSDPDTLSTLYYSTFELTQDTILKARAYYPNWFPSSIMEETYYISSANPPELVEPMVSGIQTVYPNPFSQSINVAVTTKQSPQEYLFLVYNLKGQCVYRTAGISSGSFDLSWDGKGSRGQKLPAGIYFLRFNTKEHTSTKRVVLY